MNLTLTQQPSFSQVANTGLVTGATLAAADIQAINEDAKFAAVRTEEFYGYYKNGETVALPVSPADGYQYSRTELAYEASLYWTGSSPYGLNGLIIAPYRGPTSAGGQAIKIGYGVDQATGAVSCAASYAKDGLLTVETDTTDGIVMVTTIARRMR